MKDPPAMDYHTSNTFPPFVSLSVFSIIINSKTQDIIIVWCR